MIEKNMKKPQRGEWPSGDSVAAEVTQDAKDRDISKWPHDKS